MATREHGDTAVALPSTVRRYLLALARASLSSALGESVDTPAPPPHPALEGPVRAFVSWSRNGRVLGCKGGIDPSPSLSDAVRHYAVQAGLHDARSRGVQTSWLRELTCRIFVLSEPAYMPQQGLEAIIPALVPGPGVIVRLWNRKALFLPGAWERYATPDRFMPALCEKAGIDPLHEDGKLSAWTFETETFSDLPGAHDHGTPRLR